MNKKIVFNKSSLLSLKAELLKKQEEVSEKKRLPQNKLENFKVPVLKTSTQNETKQQKKPSLSDNLKNTDNDDLEAYIKTKKALEKKTKLYEHLSNPIGDSQLAEGFLVDFKAKKQEHMQSFSHTEKQDVSQEGVESITPEFLEQDSDWVEFRDCLGRTRKCHKSDLEFYKKRDRDLMSDVSKHNTALESDSREDENLCDKPVLVQKTNEYLQSLREKWEQQEKELLSKDKDVHYQDLLYDEARMHGVGYYSFSTDETQRCKQMEELIKRREETLKAQRETEEIRKKREQLIEARVTAARARQRARAGLPPEEPKENTKDFTTCLLEFLTQQKNEADAKAAEKEKNIKEEEEKERQKLRDAYVREWDIGKKGVEEKIHKFREMSQEEYVEQQREKRIDEFAPPSNIFATKCETSFDDKGKSTLSLDNKPSKKSWSDVRTENSLSIQPVCNLDEDFSWNGGLYFTTNKKSSPIAPPHKANSIKNVINPIVNEMEEDIPKESKKGQHFRKTEIAPPPTYEYYGPSNKRFKNQKPYDINMTEAYEQGLKSLESKNNKNTLSKRYDFTF